MNYLQAHDELAKLGGYVMEKRGLVPMKGKGEVLTYWLNGTDSDCAIKKRNVVQSSKLRPLFSQPKLGGNSEQVSRRERKSPRMSIVPSDHLRNSFRERASISEPNHRRNSGNVFENGASNGGGDRPPDSPNFRQLTMDGSAFNNGSVTTLDSTTGKINLLIIKYSFLTNYHCTKISLI